MQRANQFICLLFITVSLLACNGTIFVNIAMTDTPVSQATNIPTDAVITPTPDPGNLEVVTPTLSGGFPLEGLVLAGHVYTNNTCYDLAIYQDGHYLVLSCRSDFTYSTSIGVLDEYKLAYLHQWAERFQSFEGPAAHAFLRFLGKGITVPEFSDMVAMEAMISDIEWDAHGYIHKGGLPGPVLHAMSVLSSQLGIPLEYKDVLNFDVVDFPDTCLGVSEAGETCAQVATRGYRIRLVAQGLLYECHTDLFGYDIRQFGGPQIAPVPTPMG